MILMGIAIVCGLGASYMTSRLLADRSQGEPEVSTVRVLVAKKHLDMGTQVKVPHDLLEEKEFMKGTEPKNALIALDQTKGKYLRRTLRKGDHITGEDITDEYVCLPVPPGMRGVGLRVSLENIAGGFASLPGSRVDVISTFRKESDDVSQSRILLENVLVLAADSQSSRDDRGAMPASVVTVAVTPEDALKVAIGKDLGTMSLVVRGVGDNNKAEQPRMTFRQWQQGNKPSATEQKFEEPKSEVVKVAPEPVVEKPEVRRWVVTVVDGDRSRKVQYVLNQDGDVSQDEVRDGLVAPQAAPQLSPTPPPLAVPAAPKAALPKGRGKIGLPGGAR